MGGGEGQTMCIMDNLKVATRMEINLNNCRRIKFGPRLKLNCNIYKIICCGLILSLVLFPFVLGYGNVG